MIGSGLKKLAQEHGMNVDKGVAYGSLGGWSLLRRTKAEVSETRIVDLK